MNKIIKIVSSSVAAVVMLTGGVVYAGAANAPDCSKAVQGSNCRTVSSSWGSFMSEVEKKVGCIGETVDAESALEKLCKANGNCDVNSVLDKLCKANGNCDINSLLEQLCGRKLCPDTQSPEHPTEPAETTEPTEAPTVAPTEAPTQAPTQEPTTAPTEAPTQAPTTAPQVVTEPATTQPVQTSDFNRAYEDEVIRLVNVERAKYGLQALAKRDDATNAAEIRAKEIVRNFSHTRPNGTSCFTVASELGISYRSVGENIAYGYSTPAQVVNGWMNSAGHRANILSSSFTGIGVGCYKQGNTLYWSQFFIG